MGRTRAGTSRQPTPGRREASASPSARKVPAAPAPPASEKKAPASEKKAPASAKKSTLAAPASSTHAAAAAPAAAHRKQLQLVACVGGIYVSYLAYGVLQESLYREQPDGSTFAATAFVLLVQCLGNALIAFVCGLVSDAVGFEKRVAHVSKGPDGEMRSHALKPFWTVLASTDVLLVAFVYVFAMYTSNEALKYVSYPAQALAKSCKMVPVMLGSIVLAGKRYSWQKYAAVALVTLGITAFQFAAPAKKSKGGHGKKGGDVSSASEMAGLGLLGVSLVLDGLSGPGQETLKKHGLTNFQQMLAANVWASGYMLLCALALGQIDTSLEFLGSHPSLWQTLLLFALTSAVGQLFIFYCIREFDSLLLSTITTTRKFFTIVLSILVYPENSLNLPQWLSVAVVFAGLVLDSVAGGKKDHHGGHGGGGGDKKQPESSKKSATA